jgi:hypothetical protein
MDVARHPNETTATGLFLLCLGVVSVAWGQSMDSAYGPPRPAVKTAPVALQLESVLSAAPLHTLRAAEDGAKDKLAALQAWNAARKRPVQTGFSRPLSDTVALRLSPSLAGKGGPLPLSGGFVADGAPGWLTWGTSVAITGAHRVRLHLTSVRLPTGTQLFVSAPGGTAHAFGLELLAPAGDLWTPSVAGERVNFEVHVPAASLEARSGFNLNEVVEILDIVSAEPNPAAAAAPSSLLHPVSALSSSAAPFAVTPKDDSCLIDSSCETNANFNDIDDYRHAIAALEFICSGLNDASPLFEACIGGDAYVCTGSLLNDTQSDGTPYLLSANHCFPDQETASTLEAWFDFYTSKCNGTLPDENTKPMTNGATLLATRVADIVPGASDFAFMLLDSLPDSNRFFLGWNANASALQEGTPLYRLSHPYPDSAADPLPQQYTQYTNDPNTTIADCQPFVGNFVVDHAIKGSTSGGSSGSPIMLSNGQVVGELTGGCGTDLNNDCDVTRDRDFDGAFSVSYPQGISQYLNVAPGPTTPCVPSATKLCIDDNPGDGRFQITVAYNTSQNGGLSGSGNSIPLSSLGITQGGIFWFFSATNPEMLIKVINACTLNNKFWVFYSAGTNAGFTVTVSDTNTGHQKFYVNPDLTSAAPVQDTAAIACP